LEGSERKKGGLPPSLLSRGQNDYGKEALFLFSLLLLFSKLDILRPKGHRKEAFVRTNPPCSLFIDAITTRLGRRKKKKKSNLRRPLPLNAVQPQREEKKGNSKPLSISCSGKEKKKRKGKEKTHPYLLLSSFSPFFEKEGGKRPFQYIFYTFLYPP